MDLSVIVLSYNTKKLTLECIKSVRKHTKGVSYEIVVVDNASSDGSTQELLKLGKKIKLIKSKKNLGFAGGNNLRIKEARGKYMLFLNSDTLVKANVLGEMVGWMDRNNEIVASSCALKNMDGSFQGTGGYFPTLLRVASWMTIQDFPLVDRVIKPFHPLKDKSPGRNDTFYTKQRELDWLTGAFVLVRAAAVREVGGWDVGYFMYVEDVDWCYRLKKTGGKVVYNPKWSIIHYGGASGTREKTVLAEFEGLKRFYKINYPKWQFPLLRVLFKIGSLGRIVLFGVLEGKEAARIYAKAFRKA